MSDDIDEVEAAIKRLSDTSEALQVPVGTLVAGRFEIMRRLGMGAMGAVYLATQKSVGRQVALKTLQSHFLKNEQLLRRFYLEAKAASRLDHPNIVKIYDFGIDETLGMPFIAMEYLAGDDLGELIFRQGPLSEADATGLLAQVAKALVEAHDKGIVHRDLKPDNIHVRQLSDGDRQCKVLDFGIAKVVHGASESEANLTGSGMTIGTPMYMSPEQVASRPVDFRADLYSLGCILFELVVGRQPFCAGEGDRMKVLLAHLNDPIPDLPDTLVDGRPPSDGLRQIVQNLMAKHPDARPGSTASVARALSALSRSAPMDLASLLSPQNASHRAPSTDPEMMLSTMEAPGLTPADLARGQATPTNVSPDEVGLATDETAAFVGLDKATREELAVEDATNETAAFKPAAVNATNETAAFIPAPATESHETAALTPAPEPDTDEDAPAPDAAESAEVSDAPPAPAETRLDRPPPAETRVDEPEASEPPAPLAQPGGSTAGLWMGLAALVIAGGIGWAMTRGDVAPAPQVEAPVATTPPAAPTPAPAVPTPAPKAEPVVAAPSPAPPPTAPPIAVEAKPTAKPPGAVDTKRPDTPRAKAPARRAAKAAPSAAPAAKAPPSPTAKPKPAKGPSIGGTSVRTGPLAKREARRVTSRASGKLKSCFKKAGLSSPIKVRILVGAEGNVKSLSVKPSSAGAFKSCVSGTVRSLRFPKTPGAGFSAVEVTVKP